MSFFIYNLKGKNPYYNIAFEEYLFTEHDKFDQDIYLVFYENSEAVILGKNLVKDQETYTHKKLPPVIRRCSGGGSVVHFKGNLNFGLILNTKEYSQFSMITTSYEKILNCVSKSLNSKFIIKHDGISDLCIEEKYGSRKISGNSQARKKNWLLHHGTILYDVKNINKISKFLRHPPKEPDYRKGRPHKDFLITYLPYTTRSVLAQKLTKGFAVEFDKTPCMRNVTSDLEISSRQYLNKILSQKFRC
ncbi:MAG: hypothetical protein OEV78_08630 [Spirochaetia bacterium]|nr:hypothetical protein [Spirochaetia bacterium]